MQPSTDLTGLAAMSLAELRAAWRKLYRSDAPQSSADLLARALAWASEARTHGGLDPAVVRELEQRHAMLDRGGTGEPRLKSGTRLVRDWGGRRYVVLVEADAYVFEDRRYASLSQIAETITGTHWSGPRFFGLKTRSRRRAAAAAAEAADPTMPAPPARSASDAA